MKEFYLFFFRLWHKLLPLFNQTEKKTEIEVAEKIEIFRMQSIQMAGDLKRACRELKGKVDQHEYDLVNSLVKPLIRRVQCLPHKASEMTSQTQLSDLLDHTEILATSAHKWVNLCTEIKHRDEIIQEALKAAADHSLSLIDRDLKLIEEYRRWRESEVGAVSNGKSSLRAKLQRQLRQQVGQLGQLKTMPVLTLEELNGWRDRMDRLRNRYVNAALRIIDKL